jgi:hypothetical protein
MRDPQDYAGTWVFLQKAKWKETFAILPHVCRISKRWIWLKKAYKGVATYTGPVLPVTETHWHESGEHIKWLLTKPNTIHEYYMTIGPGIRKMMPSIIAQDIINVQPMSGDTLNKVKINKKLLVITNKK